MAGAVVMASAVHVRHDEVNGGQVRDQIGNHAAANDLGNHLEMRKARSTDAGSITHSVAVAREVVAVDPLGGLDQLDGLAGRYHRTPGHGEEVRDQGFDVLE